MLRRPLTWLLWIGVLTLAAWLRLSDLTERPIHADEATGARITAERLTGDGYSFDPQHFHGPWLSLSTALIARQRGESGWPDLSLLTLRLGTAAAGIMMVLTPLLWRRSLGSNAALAAGCFLATSPLLVYYSRMSIHETWLALFGMLALPSLYHFLRQPSTTRGLLCGLWLGLMFVTKETVAISVIAWTVAIGVTALIVQYWRTDQNPLQPVSSYRFGVIAMVATAFAIAVVFYTNGLRSPQGIIDAFKTYFVYETTSGHGKAWSYYLEFLLWPKHQLGEWWSEGLIVLAGLGSALLVWAHREKLPATCLIILGGLIHVGIYSCIHYKTPWLMVLPWAQMCLLAGILFGLVDRSKPALKIAALLFLLVFAGVQTKQSVTATGRYASDDRNPYSYVPTTRDPERMMIWIEQLAQLSTADNLKPTAVIGEGYWPLPWYLRQLPEVGYWPSPNEAMRELPMLFVMPAQDAQCQEILESTHRAFPRSLRSNVAVTLYLRNDIWEQWETTEAL